MDKFQKIKPSGPQELIAFCLKELETNGKSVKQREGSKNGCFPMLQDD